MKLASGFLIGLVAAPLLLIIAAMLGRLPSNAVDAPPRWETAVGGRALDSSLEARSRGLKNPIDARDSAAIAAGMKLYRFNCAGCHGDSKAPSDWGTKGFYPRVPQFWQEKIDVRPEEAYAAIHDGVRYSGMAAWRDLMTSNDIWRVANFVSRIHSLPPGVEQDWKRHASATPPAQ